MKNENKFIEDDIYKKLNVNVEKYANLMKIFYTKAKKARNGGSKTLAKKYSKKGKKNEELMYKAENERDKKIFKHYNNERNNLEIDLHGLSVKSALKYTKDKIKKLKGSKVILNIITGAGNHSKENAKIKPEIKSYLKENNFKFSKKNKGSYSVEII